MIGIESVWSKEQVVRGFGQSEKVVDDQKMMQPI